MSKDYLTFLNDGTYSGASSLDPASRAALDTVSVVIPIYNAETHLRQALDSVLSQTHSAVEVICVNDGSTDESLAIIQDAAARDPRVIVIDKPNGGYGDACNRGIEAATGEWISILEPDDWIDSNMYADMLEFAYSVVKKTARAFRSQSSKEGHVSASEIIDIVKTPYIRVINAQTPDEKHLKCNYTGLIKPKSQPFTISDAPHLMRHHPSIWSAIYSKRFLDQEAIRFLPIPGSGWTDNPFMAETLIRAKAIAYLDKHYYHYRASSDDEEHAYIASNPAAPLKRWFEMMDVADKIGCTDETVLSALYARGCLYIGKVINSIDETTPEIDALIRIMIARMDIAAVLADSSIALSVKKLCVQQTGSHAKVPKIPYLAHLAKKAVYDTVNTGPSESLRTIRQTLFKR